MMSEAKSKFATHRLGQFLVVMEFRKKMVLTEVIKGYSIRLVGRIRTKRAVS